MQVFSRVRRLEVTIARAAAAPTSFAAAARTATTLAGENAKCLLMGTEMAASSSSRFFSSSRHHSLLKGEFMSQQIKSSFARGRAFCSTVNSATPPNSQAPAQPQAPSPSPSPPPPPPPPSYTDTDYSSSYQQTSTIRRRPYNLEAKMRMKQYRREAMHRQQALEIEEEERNFQLDQSKLYQKGDPGTMQGIVKDIITVGYFMKLPDGREGFLPCMQLGCTGGIPLLTRLFKVGDEITVRQQKMYDGGKDKLFAKKDSA